MKSKTPRTDNACEACDDNRFSKAEVVSIDFARKLERELNAALASLEYIVKTDKIMRPDIRHVQAEKILASVKANL